MDGLEIFDGCVLDEAEFAFEASIVNGDIEATEPRDSLFDKSDDVFFVANVGANELRVRVECSQFADQGLPLVVVAAGHDDLGAFLGECHELTENPVYVAGAHTVVRIGLLPILA